MLLAALYTWPPIGWASSNEPHPSAEEAELLFEKKVADWCEPSHPIEGSGHVGFLTTLSFRSIASVKSLARSWPMMYSSSEEVCVSVPLLAERQRCSLPRSSVFGKKVNVGKAHTNITATPSLLTNGNPARHSIIVFDIEKRKEVKIGAIETRPDGISLRVKE